MSDPATREADSIDGVPLPREATDLVGQAAGENDLLESYKSGRIHHGWIISGPRGIGKATLAFRFARFVLANGDPGDPAVAAATTLSIDPAGPVARKVATGSHPDLFHLRRPYDEKGKRFKTELPVDEVRRATGLFETTAGEGGWRICIVDAADDMNLNAANALLKILEEPPPRALFLILSHMPGRLLPTIRSRCRKLALRPLEDDQIRLIAGRTPLGAGQDADAMSRAVSLARGSARRALVLMAADGVAIWSALEDVTRRFPEFDRRAAHMLSDLVSQRGSDESYGLFIDFTRDWLTRKIHDGAASGARAEDLIGWTQAWETIDRLAREADILNLDRKQTALDILLTLAQAARDSLSPQRI